MEIYQKDDLFFNKEEVKINVPTIEQLAKRVIQKRPKKKKKRYDVIVYEKRVALLELILKKKQTIKSAADKLGIKLCTAKHILYLYKNQGKIHQRRQDHYFSQDEQNQEFSDHQIKDQSKDKRKENKLESNKNSLNSLNSFSKYKCCLKQQNQNKSEIKSETTESQNQIQMINILTQLPALSYSMITLQKLKEHGIYPQLFTVQNFSMLMNQNAILTNMLQFLLNPLANEQNFNGFHY